jgi:AI-2 transport protein TqsA
MQVMIGSAVIALVITALVFGSSFLIPITIAFLATNLITAASDRFHRTGLPHAAALVAALFVFLLGFGLVIYVLSGQIDAVSDAWPRYVSRFESLADRAAKWLGADISGKLAEAIDNLRLAQSVPALLGSAGSLLANFVLVALYTGFMLGERGTLSSKITSIFDDPEQASQARQAVTQIGNGIRDYIWIKTIMSVLTAAVSYAVLKTLGVDFSETWALLIFLLNYIPSIGSVLGVVFPALLALIQFETLWQFLVIAVLLSSAQFFIGNVIEPRVMGRTLNLSPLVVMMSLAFWGLIWGLAGAFMSVPLTAAIAITCSNIPNWRWLAALLSEEGETGVG